jgi:hypothetical protein
MRIQRYHDGDGKKMNYRFGKNARVALSVSTDTLEDAIPVRKGWAQSTISNEVDIIDIPINNNDILLDLYGHNGEYKAFPDIGEMVEHSRICATRRINKSHILYDFQSSNMKETYDTDTEYFASKNAIVYDIEVLYNGEDPFPTNLFHKQLKVYYDENCRYAQEMLDWCNTIKESGSNYTKNVNFFRDKYLHYNDEEYKWKNKDKAFGHIMVRFKIFAKVGISLGSKIAGRYGNKGVVGNIIDDPDTEVDEALKEHVMNVLDPDNELKEEDRLFVKNSIELVDDDRMPYTEDGVPLDLLLNASGPFRRINIEQLCEVETNFIGEQIQKKLKTLDSLEEKADMIFRFLNCVNKDECAFFMEIYQNYDYDITVDNHNIRFMSNDRKEAFIKDVEENGFYLIRPPHKPLLYDDVKRMYEEFPWVKPVDVYINQFGIKRRKIMRPMVVGSMYMLILKQNTNKNFSARSTYRLNKSNLPAKDISKKTNKSAYAKTPVRLSEIYALMPSISGRDIAEYNFFMRSSILGRKSLDRILEAEGNPLDIVKLKIKDNYSNINAEILNARLKAIGLRLNFNTEEKITPDIFQDVISPLHIGPYTILDYISRHHLYIRLFELYDEEMKKCIMIESYKGEKSDKAWDSVFELDEVKEMKFSKSDKVMIRESTKSVIEKLDSLTESNTVINELSDEESTNNTGIDENGNIIQKVPKKRGRKPKNKVE